MQTKNGKQTIIALYPYPHFVWKSGTKEVFVGGGGEVIKWYEVIKLLHKSTRPHAQSIAALAKLFSVISLIISEDNM